MNIMDKILIIILLFNLILSSLKDRDKVRLFLWAAVLVMQILSILSEVLK
ncbi:hypothetical protein LG21E12_13280 [Lactococcus garvieae]|jgi:hypothetical protein|nr:hypothetical protein OO3_00215 [Lactococcus garvieae ATCC 49156]CEF50972.1 hypothetical protein LGMT14_00832 [Lactococcus garvieae]BAV03317.1 hypothetical protein NALG_1803 [Lactococcus formosensis]EOT93065.1 hypothetical protein I578_00600 [Lactococcus garvieae ATCC 49156]BDW47747.1 hypothetical protein LG21E12_13280 [Lactococcus garvieae]